MAIYLDCNATTPLDPRVQDLILHYMEDEFGNAGSRTHEFGLEPSRAVQEARSQVATVVNAKPDEVIFTSGATESNNLALLGLAQYGESHGKRHIVSTQIEHKAVLEPLEQLAIRGFEVELVSPNSGGWVEAEAIQRAVRPDTLLVSVMHANNETGVLQPISEIVAAVSGWDGFFHIDAAQSFGKEPVTLCDRRIDLISASSHKVFGPKGVGALIARRRRFERLPLEPLMYGGGQEHGLRSGTSPVPLVAGFGLACELAIEESVQRQAACEEYRKEVLSALGGLGAMLHGDQERCMSHVVNLSIPGVNSEAAMLSLKGLIAISNGSACTSEAYEPSHVLSAMGFAGDELEGALRISWCHATPRADWETVTQLLGLLRT